MYDTKEIRFKKIKFVVGKDPNDVKATIKIVLEKTLAEITTVKKYLYPEDKEAYLKETL